MDSDAAKLCEYAITLHADLTASGIDRLIGQFPSG